MAQVLHGHVRPIVAPDDDVASIDRGQTDLDHANKSATALSLNRPISSGLRRRRLTPAATEDRVGRQPTTTIVITMVMTTGGGHKVGTDVPQLAHRDGTTRHTTTPLTVLSVSYVIVTARSISSSLLMSGGAIRTQLATPPARPRTRLIDRPRRCAFVGERGAEFIGALDRPNPVCDARVTRSIGGRCWILIIRR
jgi:hypothetical protein